MARSMTGYGKGTASGDEISLAAELRAVNSRGREIRCRLPQPLVPLEARLRERVQGVVRRGRVDLTISFEGGNPARPSFRVDREAIAALAAAWRDVAESLGVDEPPRIASIAAVRWRCRLWSSP